VSVNVAVGDAVKKNQVLLKFEAMKMENELVAPRDATVVKILVAKGDALESGQVVLMIA
jgi:biotin carboxyl carrier protein